jgi:hypothetical protein
VEITLGNYHVEYDDKTRWEFSAELSACRWQEITSQDQR